MSIFNKEKSRSDFRYENGFNNIVLPWVTKYGTLITDEFLDYLIVHIDMGFADWMFEKGYFEVHPNSENRIHAIMSIDSLKLVFEYRVNLMKKQMGL